MPSATAHGTSFPVLQTRFGFLALPGSDEDSAKSTYQDPSIVYALQPLFEELTKLPLEPRMLELMHLCRYETSWAWLVLYSVLMLHPC